jgi:hypothetical protein
VSRHGGHSSRFTSKPMSAARFAVSVFNLFCRCDSLFEAYIAVLGSRISCSNSACTGWLALVQQHFRQGLVNWDE